MPGALTIAVLSDLHLDAEASPRTMESARAAFRAAARERVDHVVVCGDLFDSASAFRHDADALRDVLREEGLWSPDRLSVVPGNHDVFEVGHLRPWQRTARSWLRPAAWTGRGRYARWAGELVTLRQRAGAGPWPFVKDLGVARLAGVDTVPVAVWRSAGGAWPGRQDVALRRALGGGGAVLLAMHYPPVPGAPATLRAAAAARDMRGLVRAVGVPRGFPPEDFGRLESFVDAVGADAVFCGHFHGGSAGRRGVGRARVFLEGRSGPWHRMFGVVEVGGGGAVTYRSLRF